MLTRTTSDPTGRSPLPLCVSLRAAFLAMLAALLLPTGAAPAMAKDSDAGEKSERRIEDGILDEIRLKTPTISADSIVVLRLFSAEKADLGTGAEGGKEGRVEAAKKIQADGPQLLATALRESLLKAGPFAEVRLDDGSPLPDNALVVGGRFTQIDPGSKAKRYWVGFGAGKSGTEVTGTVSNASGDVLAEFTQKRIAVMGAFGGDYVAKMTDDCRSIGEDIAKFLSAWAMGKSLED